MSVQKIRNAIRGFQVTCDVLTRERYVIPERGKEYVQAQDVTFWLGELDYYRRRAYEMAGAKTTPKGQENDWKGFVNYVLSESDKAEYSTWEIDDHDLWLLVAGHEQCGYKLTCSFNSKNDTFNANYICTDENSPNKGYCLSAFAPDWYHAVRVLAYKHEVVLDGLWIGKESKQKNNWG